MCKRISPAAAQRAKALEEARISDLPRVKEKLADREAELAKQKKLAEELKSRRVYLKPTKEQKEMAIRIAGDRNRRKQKKFGAMNYKSQIKPKRTGYKTHFIGMVGEVLAAQFCGGEVDETISDDHGDNGIDTNVPGVGECGIKTTTHTGEPWLRVEVEHFKENMIYIACAYDFDEEKGDDQEFYIAGWATSDEVKHGVKKTLVDDGPLDLVLEEHELHPWSELQGLIDDNKKTG